MNRRSLFKSLIGVAVAVSLDLGMSSPAKFRSVHEAAFKPVKIVPNPVYAAAEYEDLIWMHEDMVKIYRAKVGSETHIVFKNPDPVAPRYNFVDGKWVRVSPYKKIES